MYIWVESFSMMATDNDDYTFKLRLLGGRGNAATWQWEVYAPGGLLPGLDQALDRLRQIPGGRVAGNLENMRLFSTVSDVPSANSMASVSNSHLQHADSYNCF